MRKRITKAISSALCAAALVCALCAAASAEVDPYYSGDIDPATGEAVAESPTAVRVRVNDTTYYDRESGFFVYPTLSGIYEVRASVADGMIVNEAVRVTADDGVELSLSRNGTTLEGADLSNIAEVGTYTVTVKDVDAMVALFGFTIVGEYANLPGGYVMPDGFYILDATLDGEDTYYERGYIGMEDEGLYEIEYVCSDTSVRYHLTTTVDRTPPEITLEGKLDKNGRFHSAVQVGGLEGVTGIALTRDGESMPFPYGAKLSEAGMYQLTAFDAAGNAATEQFTILVYLDLNSLLFFALICVSLAGVLGYILYKRKMLRVS